MADATATEASTQAAAVRSGATETNAAATAPEAAATSSVETGPSKQDESFDRTDFAQAYKESSRVIFKEYAQHEIFYKVLKAVSETGDEAELEERILAFPEMKVHLRAPRYYLDALYASGALDRTPLLDPQADADAQQGAAGEGDDAIPSPPASSPVRAETEDSSDAAQAGLETVAAQAEPAKANVAEAASETAKQGGEGAAAEHEPDPEAAQPQPEPEPERYEWALTAVGEKLIDDLSPVRRLHDLLSKDPKVLSVYTTLLSLCEKPRKRQELERAVEGSGMLDGMGVYTSYFTDRLEQNGGLVWDEGWRTTPEGKVCLAQVQQSEE